MHKTNNNQTHENCQHKNAGKDKGMHGWSGDYICYDCNVNFSSKEELEAAKIKNKPATDVDEK